jgi:hypothetical protein
MTATTTTGRPPVNLRDPAQLLAALPYLLGFRPENSVVLLGHRPPNGNRIGLVLRADLPPRSLRTQQAKALAPRMSASGPTGVTVAVVGGKRRSGGPPHAGFIERLRDAFARQGIRLLHEIWTPEIAAGSPWGCYRDEDCGGVLPDPHSTVAAAAVTEAGQVTYGSRAEMEAMLAARSPESVARLSERLSLLHEPPWPEEDRVAAGAAEILTALERMRRGHGLPTEDEVLRLACALSVKEVRDACITLAVPPGSPQAREADALWLSLVKELPAPERAEAAALLGYSAYVCGAGVFAGMALENALEADPNHLMAGVLADLLERGVPPVKILGLGGRPGLADLAAPELRPGETG